MNGWMEFQQLLADPLATNDPVFRNQQPKKKKKDPRLHHQHCTGGIYIPQKHLKEVQEPEENRLTTTAKAINAPQRHFSQMTWRQVVAHPVAGAGGFTVSRFGSGAFLRMTSAWRVGVAVTGLGVVEEGDIGAEVDPPLRGPLGTRVIIGDSGFPRDRSPIFGRSRSSGAQYCG